MQCSAFPARVVKEPGTGAPGLRCPDAASCDRRQLTSYRRSDTVTAMRALVLGCGSIGSRHARNLGALGVDVTVSDPNLERARAVAAQVGCAVATDREGVAADVAIVATPSIHHPADAGWCLERGMHTFVEKPIAATPLGLDLAVSVAASSDRVTMVACNLRFSEGYRALREQLATIGRIITVVADFGWYLPAWRPDDDYRSSYSSHRDLGGGVILDAAIHELDYVIDIAGPVTSVAGMWTASNTLGIEVEDAAGIQMRHRDGCISQIHVDYLRRTYSRSCTVVGADGTLVWNLAQGSVTTTYETHGESVVTAGLDEDRNTMYVEEMRHFLEAAASGHNEVNTIGQAAATTAVALRVLDLGGV